ncbi:MAG TPA: branched-chain amino acid ABC transporter permease, partial [Methylomirabilota bacterium]|nr:branched-chain amino acid ABC transporter permease [Methylomirabilota bacterium]
MTASARPVVVALAAVFVGLAALLEAGLPAFYESFLYLIFSWMALATSWSLLSGYAGYFSFGHGAFFGAGMYTTATLTAGLGVPFLWTLPAAGLVAALLAAGIGAVVFRMRQLRGELFGLLTLAITFVLATIVLNTRIDGGPGVYLSGVALPRLARSPTGTLYLLALTLAVGTVGLAYAITRSRFGLGLYAIHDDEDVAEVEGVPTFRYKLTAFVLSAGIAGMAGGVQAVYVSYITVGETFSITVPLYVVLMSVLGGARHWFGPAIGAAFVTGLTYAFVGGEWALFGRAAVGLTLILAILFLPQGVMGLVARHRRRRAATIPAAASPAVAAPVTPVPAPPSVAAPSSPASASSAPLLVCENVQLAFSGVRALAGVGLELRHGEILGLVGPNGSG